MNAIETVVDRMRSYGERPSIFWRGESRTYGQLLRMIDAWSARLPSIGVGVGTICAVVTDYSPETAALFFALMRAGSIVVPFARNNVHRLDQMMDIACVDVVFRIAADDSWTIESRTAGQPANELLTRFRETRSPGLIVFTSGSTGEPKGILHDAERVMRKFVKERQGWRTVLFLMVDHFGGFNSLLSSFANGGAAVCLPDRSPHNVCAVMESTRATLLATTPTFLNLLIASGSHRLHDLSSLELITYGTEVMNEETLRKVRGIFPNAAVKQTYGLSELGVLRSKSQSDDSLWVKIGGDGFEVKVLDDVLWIRSEANMVGYLNAPSPFDSDGWMCTGDHVEVDGEYMRILGRKSELIFVGGEKVFPAEVEALLLEDPNVLEATVFGVRNPLMGQVVNARVTLASDEDVTVLTARLRRLCVGRLAPYKIPIRVSVVADGAQRSERFKKIRRATGGPSEEEPAP